MSFVLDPLPYAYDALAPHMSAETLEFHHDKHHAAYVNNANNLIKGTEWEGLPMEQVITGSFGKNPGVFNNVAQIYNHAEFWKYLKPNGGGKVPGKVEKALVEAFGSVDKALEELANAGATQFGSGWAWLQVKDGKVSVAKTPNAENPLVHGASPILTIDVWEHAYYIDYRNLRPKFIKTVIDSLINWEYVEAQYEKAMG
ncbi:superoxide dismutase [Rhodoblastus acidophilus]|uniref:Superoxide dismutase n=1 Tax=Candidatus Rhodoblastus alkanivorans TaxID=2954117 RepID=A0ABS9Z955_9HYPH|nr:superoxide dismutase [Candidatus Rhodoblastus alkanivorans]MCI4677985.1 superoxide dismutase [Candidatus Rhodoblastus alkanivorans]MCI4683880.1 superoxide dismutase [Candidatus Rhodoblastus alkanivorans]MDI4641198.1 superoxide dismutase [Rhodoblastus acidophilus]